MLKNIFWAILLILAFFQLSQPTTDADSPPISCSATANVTSPCVGCQSNAQGCTGAAFYTTGGME